MRFSRAALKDAQAVELNEASKLAAAAEAAGSAPGHQLSAESTIAYGVLVASRVERRSASSTKRDGRAST